jgi:hypothetical protein
MASCDTTTYTNILDRPQVQNATAGDYFIVEKPEGTSIIDYSDVVWELGNTYFGDTITQNTTNITIVSASLSSTQQFIASAFKNYLPLSGGTITGDVTLTTGTKVYFGAKGENKDTFTLDRVNLNDDSSALRLSIADNNKFSGAIDVLHIGRTATSGTTKSVFTPVFSVSSNGNVGITGKVTVESSDGVIAKNTAKAWVNFNADDAGDQDYGIRSSYNVSSISEKASLSGWYVNFTNPLKDNKYVAIASGMQFAYNQTGNNQNSGDYPDIVTIRPDTTSRCFIQTWYTSSQLSWASDFKTFNYVGVIVFGE